MTVAVLISAVIGALPYAAGAVEAPLVLFKRYAVRYFRGALSDPARRIYRGNRSVSRGVEFVSDIVFGTPDRGDGGSAACRNDTCWRKKDHGESAESC